MSLIENTLSEWNHNQFPLWESLKKQTKWRDQWWKEVSGMLQGVAIDEYECWVVAIMRGGSLGYPWNAQTLETAWVFFSQRGGTHYFSPCSSYVAWFGRRDSSLESSPHRPCCRPFTLTDYLSVSWTFSVIIIESNESVKERQKLSNRSP